jgi:RNA polymerase sigma-70 factor (ECF subfamily)
VTPPAHNLAELELADRARSGDQDALVELYGRYRETLHRHAVRMLRSEAAAQDMVQEAFARAIASLPQTRQELHFRAWMVRIVTNLCLRELTRGQRDAPYDRDPDLLASERRELDPQQARHRAEIGARVERALDALPHRYRQILLLREVEELSYDELAETLELSESSVKVTLHRARARFAAEFLAARLLAERDAPRGCAELRAIIDKPSPPVRAVVRHLESCVACKQQEQRSAAELLALLPPLPAERPLAWRRWAAWRPGPGLVQASRACRWPRRSPPWR